MVDLEVGKAKWRRESFVRIHTSIDGSSSF